MRGESQNIRFGPMNFWKTITTPIPIPKWLTVSKRFRILLQCLICALFLIDLISLLAGFVKPVFRRVLSEGQHLVGKSHAG